MNIYQRVNAVMKAVEYVQKDATVSTGGDRAYKAVTHDMVLAVLRKSMVEHGIVTVPRLVEHAMIHTRGANPKEQGQYSQHLYQAIYEVRFVNIEKADDVIAVTVPAHANDSGDKAPGKALSYAVKCAMLKVFGLETGENEEGRFHERPPYTEEQFDRYHGALEAGDAMEFLCMEKQVDIATWTALYNSFPEGKKVIGKRQASDLTAKGWAKVAEIAETLSERIAKHDNVGVLEVIQEMGPTEKKLVAAKLSDHEVTALRKLSELAA